MVNMNKKMSRSIYMLLVLFPLLTTFAVTSAQLRCEPPRQWEGDMYYGDKARVGPTFHYKWSFDVDNERIATTVTPENGSSKVFSPIRQIVLYREHVEYSEDLEKKTCERRNINDTFPGNFIRIPPDAKYMTPLYIGAEGYGLGLRVDLWRFSDDHEEYVSTVSHQGCVPVSITSVGIDGVFERFYNIKTGVNPDHFVPGPECPTIQ